MGAGQQTALTLRKLSVTKAIENLKTSRNHKRNRKVIGECVFVFEAFLPFPDSIDEANSVGAKFIVQRGGSIRDAEVIEALPNTALQCL